MTNVGAALCPQEAPQAPGLLSPSQSLSVGFLDLKWVNPASQAGGRNKPAECLVFYAAEVTTQILTFFF